MNYFLLIPGTFLLGIASTGDAHGNTIMPEPEGVTGVDRKLQAPPDMHSFFLKVNIGNQKELERKLVKWKRMLK